MKLIVGLGNPGDKYKNTRHNAGFLAIDHLSEYFGFDKFKKIDKFKARVSEGQINGDRALLLKPQTFMNLSGDSVQSVMSFYKIPIENLIVIYDDVDIAYGSLKVRPHGSPGGHNGMRSIAQQLGTQEFIRIRLGIMSPEEFKGALEDYVLGRLTIDQEDDLISVIRELPAIIEMLEKEGIEEVMQRYN